MNNELTAALLTIEKCRELSGCPAGVDLQDWVKQLAAENVALKLKGRELLNEASKVYQKYNATIDFYSGDFMDGQTLHEFQFVLEADTPATDRIVAGIKADGVDIIRNALIKFVEDEVGPNDVVPGLIRGAEICVSVADSLREGDDK
ncbi:hypothetical protein [Klebsiella aerogenes]|uniref:hypothetical protein n=1 Tax=Klebsiella aerogenes TaxID=548 RepID=UPI0015EABAD4|nr:hypothetical protein [Klebsiella aerogenes]QLS44090.1 hypothetical protein HV316_06680 [Klebsiella aerogenes]HBQ2461463.1 hypothetical protein [Klebsiella aerogenes]HBQ2595853.1 hypothetical protein [Klebsiella aerogenes]HDT5500179.1 hypothetical protein [Klebsiella aerogenes]HEM7501308.1 hypothetical protein [Klebsiella aerogenes]